jgi:hypothetical protein
MHFDLKSDHVRQPHPVCGFLALNDLLKCTGRDFTFVKLVDFTLLGQKMGRAAFALCELPVIKANQLSLATWDPCRGVCFAITHAFPLLLGFDITFLWQTLNIGLMAKTKIYL